MTWAHEQMELPISASSREIKRAYAHLLKKTRPQDDAKGFQRLKAAYDFALQWATQQEESTVAKLTVNVPPSQATLFQPVSGWAENYTVPSILRFSSMEVSGGEPSYSAPRTVASPYEVAEQLLRTAGSAQFPKAEAFSDWLQDQPEFWSLAHKEEVGTAMPGVLQNFFSPLSAVRLNILWSFFGLNLVSTAHSPEAAAIFLQKRLQLNGLWLFSPEGYEELVAAWGTEIKHDMFLMVNLKIYINQLEQPYSEEQIKLANNQYKFEYGMTQFVMFLTHLCGDKTPPHLDNKQVDFWRSICKKAQETSKQTFVFQNEAVVRILTMIAVFIIMAILRN
jgi:hypothetical protein